MTERFERRFQVGWGDLDGNAHMANTAFLDRAADTRMLFFAANGFPMKRFAEERFGPAILHDDVVYRKELRLLDEFTVDLELVGLSADGVRFRLRNTVRNAAGETACVVTSDGLWFDLDKRRPRVPPPDLLVAGARLTRAEDFAELAARST